MNYYYLLYEKSTILLALTLAVTICTISEGLHNDTVIQYTSFHDVALLDCCTC